LLLFTNEAKQRADKQAKLLTQLPQYQLHIFLSNTWWHRIAGFAKNTIKHSEFFVSDAFLHQQVTTRQ